MRGALILLSVVVSGCATAVEPREILTYSGPGDQAAFEKARYECLREAPIVSRGEGYSTKNVGNYASMSGPSCGAITSCMTLKGYQLDPQGQFSPAPGTGVPCIPAS